MPDFPIDAGIFTAAKISVGGSTDTDADKAIANNQVFPAGDIQVGHISVSGDSGQVGVQSSALPAGTSVTFEISASAQSGIGVYGRSSDAVAALGLSDPISLSIPDVAGERYLLLDFGYTAAVSASDTQPIGLLGSVTFGGNVSGDSTFALLHRFDGARGAFDVVAESFHSWRLPRHVAVTGAGLNIAPETWLIVELDGSLSLKLASTLGWNLNFAKDLTVLGVTHDLSAKIDAGLSATFGFDVSGKYILVVAREDASQTVRVILSRQKTKGWNFGLNLNVGIQGADPALPADFNDFIQSTFGVHGLQVLSDLQQWADPTNDLGQKIAGLIGTSIPTQLESDLVQQVTGIPLATVLADFNTAKQQVTAALAQWAALPDKVSAMVWKYLDQDNDDFKTFLTDLATPATGAKALATALQNATLGDSKEGEFLESVADQGLLALADDIPLLSTTASKVLDILNGGLLTKLQAYINQNLDLNQISAAIAAADPSKLGVWLQNRLANFLDHTLSLADLKDIQTAITTLNTKIAGYYTKAVTAMTNKYSIAFAETYQRTTTDTALIDVCFDLSQGPAAALFAEVVAHSRLDNLLTGGAAGVTLNQATLTHDINRKSTIDLNMPYFDFTRSSVNDAMVTLQAENLGVGLLLYQGVGKDTVTQNRASSQLSVLASLKVAPGVPPVLDSDGSVSYELRMVKPAMRPVDLEAWTTPFVGDYLGGLFSGGDPASIRTFYTDLDSALTAATHSQSNFLGDVALSMQLSLPASVLSGWFQQRSSAQLASDQRNLSRALQTAWRQALPALYFQNLGNYNPSDAVAALLVWSSMPVAAGITLNDDGKLSVNDGTQIFWEYNRTDLCDAVAGCSLTVANLSAKLGIIHGQLVEAGSSNAGFFDSSQTSNRLSDASSVNARRYLQSLLYTESQLIGGAANALKQISATLAAAKNAPTSAMNLLAKFVAQLTSTFNSSLSQVYVGIQADVIGPLLLVEASAALGSAGVPPSALMTVYSLNPGHAFNLGDFVTGAIPPKADIALTQTLVSLN